MEENRNEFADLARRTGLTEEEAHVFYHLDRAAALYFRLPETGGLNDAVKFASNHQELVELLALRAVRRDHPEGWRDTAEKYLEKEEEGA